MKLIDYCPYLSLWIHNGETCLKYNGPLNQKKWEAYNKHPEVSKIVVQKREIIIKFHRRANIPGANWYQDVKTPYHNRWNVRQAPYATWRILQRQLRYWENK